MSPQVLFLYIGSENKNMLEELANKRILVSEYDTYY
jgi:hypothetical protein